MKKIIGMVIASLVFGNIGFAEIREIEDGSLCGLEIIQLLELLQ
jgi:hypothetical protein